MRHKSVLIFVILPEEISYVYIVYMIDLVIAALFAAGLYIGYRKGMVKQMGSLVALFVAILACHFFGDAAAGVAASLMGTGQEGPTAHGGYVISSLVGNAMLFFAVWLGFGLLTGFIHDFLKAIHLGPVNGLAGAILMCFKVMLVTSIAINLWAAIDPDSPTLKKGGTITELTRDIAPRMLDVAKDNF